MTNSPDNMYFLKPNSVSVKSIFDELRCMNGIFQQASDFAEPCKHFPT